VLYLLLSGTTTNPQEKREQMLKTAEQVQVGDVIIYRTWGGENRQVTVTLVSSDIKNGRAGFEGIVIGWPADYVWGYCSQIVKFVSHNGE
jgi:hypothetical protein